MGKDMNSLINQVISHKKYGPMKVLRILSHSDKKIEALSLDDRTKQVMILSNAFFDAVEDYCGEKDKYVEERKKAEKRSYTSHGSPSKKGRHRKSRSRPSPNDLTEKEDYYYGGRLDDYHSIYTCPNCGFEITSFTDIIVCPDCGFDDIHVGVNQ